MFIKPSFCCSCGEKIQRAEWGLLTSRRFCDVCSVENKGDELLLYGAVVVSVLFGLFGLGSYLRVPNAVQPQSLRTVTSQRSGEHALEQPRSPGREDRPAAPLPAPLSGASADPTGIATKGQTPPPGPASEQPVYYCGALTKKGKPCSRRVKTKGRCWQHTGQPPAIASQTVPDVY